VAGGAVGCRHTRLGLRRRFCGGRRWLEVVGPLRHAHLRASPRAAMQAAHSPDRAQAKAMPGHGGRPCLPSACGLGPSNPATAAAAAPGRGGLQHLERRDGGLQHLGRRDDDSDLGRGGRRRHQPPPLASRTLLRPPRRASWGARRAPRTMPQRDLRAGGMLVASEGGEVRHRESRAAWTFSMHGPT